MAHLITSRSAAAAAAAGGGASPVIAQRTTDTTTRVLNNVGFTLIPGNALAQTVVLDVQRWVLMQFSATTSPAQNNAITLFDFLVDGVLTQGGSRGLAITPTGVAVGDKEMVAMTWLVRLVAGAHTVTVEYTAPFGSVNMTPSDGLTMMQTIAWV